MIGSCPISQVAVGFEEGILDLLEIKKYRKNNTFLFFPAFWEISLISFQNNCYTATAFIKNIAFHRFLEKIEIISSSTFRSSSVAVC